MSRHYTESLRGPNKRESDTESFGAPSPRPIGSRRGRDENRGRCRREPHPPSQATSRYHAAVADTRHAPLSTADIQHVPDEDFIRHERPPLQTDRRDSPLFPRPERQIMPAGTRRGHIQNNDVVDDVGDSSNLSEVMEAALIQDPRRDARNWYGFMNRHPAFFERKEDSVTFVKEAIRSLEKHDSERANRCLELAVLFVMMGGKPQDERDEFFEAYRSRTPAIMDKFQGHLQGYHRYCSSRLRVAPSRTGHRTPDDDISQISARMEAMNTTAPLESHWHHQPEDRHDIRLDQWPSIDAPMAETTSRSPSIRGSVSNAEYERLDPQFRRRDPRRAGTFFKVGRVFAIISHAEQSSSDETATRAKWITRTGDLVVYSSVCTFAVVREGHGFCWAVPIETGNNRGTRKKVANAEDLQAYAVIYDSDQNPPELPGERLMKMPIAVDRTEGAEALDPASRINFQKVTSIEHNVRAKGMGKVAVKSMRHFEHYWKQHLLGV